MASAPPSTVPERSGAVRSWIDRNVLALGREMRLSYLPPLMVYVAAGISGLTAIVATFYIKERLGSRPEFWPGSPSGPAAVGAQSPARTSRRSDLALEGRAGVRRRGLIAASVVIMIGLLDSTESMRAFASVEAWFVCPPCSRRSGTSCRTSSPTR
jgi:hypothetical protein